MIVVNKKTQVFGRFFLFKLFMVNKNLKFSLRLVAHATTLNNNKFDFDTFKLRSKFIGSQPIGNIV